MATKKQLAPRVFFDQKEADKAQPPNGPTGQPMRRTFVEWTARPNGVEVEALPQVWRCPLTGPEVTDDWQKHCLNRAVELAVKSEGEVLFYHTRAWRANSLE
jgi:hypothetical protein